MSVARKLRFEDYLSPSHKKSSESESPTEYAGLRGQQHPLREGTWFLSTYAGATNAFGTHLWQARPETSRTEFIPVSGIYTNKPHDVATNLADLGLLASKEMEPWSPHSPKSWWDLLEAHVAYTSRDAKVAKIDWQNYVKRVEEFRNLQCGWDSYNASTPGSNAIANSKLFIKAIRYYSFVPTRIMPSVVGGIGFTFHVRTRKTYFEFYNNGKACLLFSDGQTDPRVDELSVDTISLLNAALTAREYLDGSSPSRWYVLGNESSGTTYNPTL